MACVNTSLTSVTGIRLGSGTTEMLPDSNDQTHKFDRKDIELIVESQISFMPSGLADTLTDRELRKFC